MNAYLELAAVTTRYGSFKALDNVDLAIERGSVLALLGPNGAGKSTLFGCLLGLTRMTSGTILREGRPLQNHDRVKFGYLAERVALYPQRTALENAIFFGQLNGQPESQALTQLRRVGLSHVQDRKVRQLSKGMLQRLGLAIALCGEPELLVLDEPFNGLDPALLDTLQGVLREEQERGTTLLISTHTMSAVEPLASHVAILLNGKLAAFGTLEELQLAHRNDSLETIYHRIARSRHEAEEVFA